MSKKNEVLRLKYIDIDDFGNQVYQDQFNQYWKNGSRGSFQQPSLYSASGLEGEMGFPIKQEFVIEPLKGEISEEKKNQYRMLDRLRTDCEYYFGNRHRHPGCLWAGNEQDHIKAMKEIWNSFSEKEKPQWLTWQQIEAYEKEMLK